MPIIIHPGKCDQADECSCPSVCQQGAWKRDASGNHWEVDEKKCTDCGVCVHMCPAKAVILVETEEEKQNVLDEIKNDTIHTPETLFVERYGGCPVTESVVINAQSVDDKISAGIVLLEFFNEDSIKCLFKSPPYHKFAPNLPIYKVATDDNLKERFEVDVLPTLIIFNEGTEVDRIEGFVKDIDILKSHTAKFL